MLGLLWPDPCDLLCPQEFKIQARKLLRQVAGCNPGTTNEDLRKALFKFIADFANWDLASNRTYLDVSRALVKAAHGEEPPLVVDPFAGGGSIPLEALRLGCEAFASDLNPVACLCQIASKSDPFSRPRATPSDGSKTGVAEPHIAEQSRSWRAVNGERWVMRGS